jgi:hypothetical protein
VDAAGGSLRSLLVRNWSGSFQPWRYFANAEVDVAMMRIAGS